MKIYADIQFNVDNSNKVLSVEVNKYLKNAEKHTLIEHICLELQGVYSMKNDNEKDIRHKERSVILQSFVLDELGNPFEAMVYFRDNNSFEKVDVIDLSITANH